MKEKCFKCNRDVVWYYMPGSESACDECVPRECSCNFEPKDGDWENEDLTNWEERVGEDGRKYPCCEWMTFEK